jgi:hypothetical protein
MIWLLTLIFLLVPQISWAQSTLPPCPEKGIRHNCFGRTIGSKGGEYVGEFRFNDWNGEGRYTGSDGHTYIGQFRNGTFHGLGHLKLPNGTIYQGDFENDIFSGLGTLTRNDGTKYIGYLRDGFYDGVGSLSLKDGTKYVGGFKRGLPDGLGIEYFPDGHIRRSGTWKVAQLVEAKPLDPYNFPFDVNAKPPRVHELSESPDSKRVDSNHNTSLESEHKKRQELEERLAAVEAKERERQQAQAPQPQRPQAVLRNERRLALIIGNSTYKVSPLDNPANDASDVAESLKKLGFQTNLVRNATLGQIREATRKFADQLPSADVALIYFAGHGIEANRKNYMIPVNADLKFEYELADQGYDAGIWLEMLESIKSNNADRVNIVILDACRNNSLIGSRNLGRGLGKMDAPSGTFLAYSTAPGKVAADGGRGERNSPFTKHLLRAMQQPNQPIEEVFKEVRRNVGKETNGAQVPWESTSLTGFFSFRQR